MVHELLQRSERRPPGDKVAALVELSDPVVFDGVAISDRERKIVAARFRVADEEGAVFVLIELEFLFRFNSLDAAEIPPEKKVKLGDGGKS